eukprot:2722201-Rhodomonas_salina.1
MEVEAERERKRQRTREIQKAKADVKREEERSQGIVKKPAPMTRKTPLEGELRSYKLRLYFPKEGAKKNKTSVMPKWLRTWFDGGRHAFNSAVRLIQQGQRANTRELKKKIVPSTPLWARSVPSRIRYRSINSACVAHNIALNAKQKRLWILRNKTKASAEKIAAVEGKYNVRCRSSRKSQSEVITIEKTANGGSFSKIQKCNDGFVGVFLRGAETPSLLFNDSKWLEDKLLDDGELKEDALLQWDKETGHVFLIVRIDIPKRIDTQDVSEKRVVGLDPGLNNFQTFYSPDGTHGELLSDGNDYIKKKLSRICEIEKLIQDKSVKKRKRQHLVQLRRKLYRKLKNWRRNAHYTAINYLLKNWEVVICPQFSAKKCMEGSTLQRMQKRRLQQWGHYEFRERLQNKAFLFPGRSVAITNEPGTTKTCCVCSHWNADLGAAKEWVCEKCQTHHDRDITGAVGNVLSQIGNLEFCDWKLVMKNRWRIPRRPMKEKSGCEPNANADG